MNAPRIFPGLLAAATLAGCGNHTMTQESNSMEPTIQFRERITVNTRAYRAEYPQRWDVVLYTPAQDKDAVWAHRIVGLPGETLSIEEGDIRINGRPLELPPALARIPFSVSASNHPAWKVVAHPCTIPLNGFYLLGDNPAVANDSRFNGPVDRDSIRGKVLGK